MVWYITFIIFTLCSQMTNIWYFGKNRLIKFFGTLSNLNPLIFTVLFFVLLQIRTNFTTLVCICSFENPYFSLRHLWDSLHLGYNLELSEDNYNEACHRTFGVNLTAVLWIEAFVTGFTLFTILCQYYIWFLRESK